MYLMLFVHVHRVIIDYNNPLVIRHCYVLDLLLRVKTASLGVLNSHAALPSNAMAAMHNHLL